MVGRERDSERNKEIEGVGREGERAINDRR